MPTADPTADLVSNLADWIEIPSITGREHDYADALARHLEGQGFDVERQPLAASASAAAAAAGAGTGTGAAAPARFNLLARTGRPEVVLCTHLDTVPPFFGVRTDREHVHGRGACDAKGQAAAMIAAAAALLAEGETRVGLLFTVGEEVDSAGAALANARLAEPWRPRFTVVGEPTDSTFVRAAKGLYKARLVATGVAGHSSQPVGPSAVHELVRCCAGLLAEGWGAHPLLGPGSLNVGEIRGGVAANVVAAHAEADVLVRAVEEPAAVEARLRAHLGEHVALGAEAKAYGPVEFALPDGVLSDTVVAFGTDAPHLPRWGTPLLFGPGSIRDAHTDHEKVAKRDLAAAVGVHVETVRGLLARLDAEVSA